MLKPVENHKQRKPASARVLLATVHKLLCCKDGSPRAKDRRHHMVFLFLYFFDGASTHWH